MKIVCDNCATKYSIADEKVRGKVFKIRCKKCSHIIVVRGVGDGAGQPVSAAAEGGFPGDDGQTIAAGGPMAAAPASGDAVWHLVVDREQIGPLSPPEVRAKFASGAVDAETYAWREGFADWLRLGSIEEFRDLGATASSGDGATRRTDTADLFAAGDATDDVVAPPSSSNDAADLFGGPSARPAAAPEAYASSGGGLFGAPDDGPQAAPSRRARTSSPGFAAAGSGGAAADPAAEANQRMTGQRNENSVLFSLNNLQALASGGGATSPAPKPGVDNRPGFANSQTEGSGLIDIRAMAASTLSAPQGGPSSRHEDPVSFSAAPIFSPMAAPILMPAAASGPPKWMWPVLGVGVLAVLGIVVVGTLLLTKKPDLAPLAAPGAAPAAAAPAAGAAPAIATAPTPRAAAAAPAQGAEPAAQAGEPAAEHRGKHVKASAAKVDRGGARVARADVPAPAAAPPPAAPARAGRKRDELDDLLNGAAPDAPKAQRREAAAPVDDNLPDQLEKGAIVAGMNRIKPKIAGCSEQYHVPGMANVSVTIGKSGRVSAASVGGSFAGTPTGSCVEKAVRSATFSPFKGSPMTLTYPFILR